ncbi:MAG: M24 family metallopeptidase [Chloroflexota bacterium]
MNKEAEALMRRQVSDRELERRWRAVRQAMKERGLDFLVMQNAIAHLSGYVRWFTDVPIGGNPSTVIFPREEEMTTIWHGGRPPAEPKPPAWAVRGVKKRLSVPIILALGYSSIYDAEQVVAELKPHGKCRVGLVGLGLMSAALYKYVTEHLSGVTFEDATDMVDTIKAVKSEEELGFLRETCRIEDEIFTDVLARVRPGRTDYELYRDIVAKSLEMGADQTNILVGSAPAGTATRMSGPSFMVNRALEKGDHVHILIETNGPGGYWGELGRVISLGKPAAELQEHFELDVKAREVTLDLLKPGNDPAAIFAANNAFLRKAGYPEERRIYAHGQGYDMVERPSLDPGETMKLAARMFISVHPTVMSPKAFVSLTDDYFMGDNGKLECLHRTPVKIFEV